MCLKKIIPFLLLVIFASHSLYAQNREDAIVGKWMSSDNNLEVEIYKDNAEFKARVIWFDDTDDKSKPMNERLDEKNNNKALRTRKIIGIIYDSSSGKEWNAKAWLTDEGLLKVRGYWHFSIFGQNMTFKKVK
jgi:uncharacterized protein (DUF2147 family)